MENFLHEIENQIISRMASAANVQPFQMKSMIKRCEELNAYYKKVRASVIESAGNSCRDLEYR